MKKILFKGLLGCMVLCFLFIEAYPQSAELNYVDTKNYPDIKAAFKVKDGAGIDVRNFSVDDIIITEGGKIRTPVSGYPFCSELIQGKFSVILVFDVSNTMQKGMTGSTNPPPDSARWKIAVRAMKNFINSLNPESSECAIIQFSSNAKILHGFSNDKDSLLQSLTLGNIILGVGTNYNAPFIIDRYRDSTHSALWMAKSAKYKPVIIFITDGNHETQWGQFTNPPTGDGRFLIADVINLAKMRDCHIFVMKIGNDVLTDTNQGYLYGLASVEGSVNDNLAMDITNPDSMNGLFDKVLQINSQFGYFPPCEVVWKTECTGGGDLQLSFPNDYNLSVSGNFTIPADVKPMLEVVPNQISFFIEDLSVKDTTVTITAKQNFVEVNQNGFSTTDSRYSIIDWGNPPFTLEKDASVTLTIRYTPTDLSYTSAEIDFDGSDCSGGRINLDVNNPDAVNEPQNFTLAMIKSINPNPSAGRTEVKFNLAESGLTKIWVTNILGYSVMEIDSRIMNSGENSVYFNTGGLSDGIYFVMMQTSTQILKRKFAVVK